MVKYYAWFLILGLILLFYAKWTHQSPNSSVIGELPPLEERVPPRLREEALERKRQKARQESHGLSDDQ